MKINVEIRTTYHNEQSRLRARATVMLDDCFVIKNVRVIDGKNGLFIDFPNFKGSDGRFRSICHPITNDCRNELMEAVLAAYKKALSAQGAQEDEPI